MDNDKPTFSLLRRIGRRTSHFEKAALQPQNDKEKQQEPLELKPAMPELGTAPCPVCGHKVAVFVTRTKRPFINCGFCSARIFYNGSRSMELLKDQIKAPKGRLAQMSRTEREDRTMTTHVVSLRLPSTVDSALERSAVDAGMSLSRGVDWLLRNSFGNYQLLLTLADCPDALDAKLDVRIPPATFEQLRSASEQIGIPVSVYTRKLLYHFFVTKELKYVKQDGHYTLAGSHD